jgi:predicted O-methyltransferase YrrM
MDLRFIIVLTMFVGMVENFELFTANDFANHPAMKSSLHRMREIHRDMHRGENNASTMHYHIHILAVAIQLLNASNVMEIGSFCGGSAALMLGEQCLHNLVTIDMVQPQCQGILSKNIQKFNVHNINVTQIYGDSRNLVVREKVFSIFPPNHLDLLFIDGDHFYSRPDFEYYQHLVKPGGLIIWDDYGHHRNVIAHVNDIARDNNACFHSIGSPPNTVGATFIGSDAISSKSNEFIMQKRYNCTTWWPI